MTRAVVRYQRPNRRPGCTVLHVDHNIIEFAKRLRAQGYNVVIASQARRGRRIQ